DRADARPRPGRRARRHRPQHRAAHRPGVDRPHRRDRRRGAPRHPRPALHRRRTGLGGARRAGPRPGGAAPPVHLHRGRVRRRRLGPGAGQPVVGAGLGVRGRVRVHRRRRGLGDLVAPDGGAGRRHGPGDRAGARRRGRARPRRVVGAHRAAAL
ncbi:MAG: hypothetical protein AVDCRST_MAG66-1769, partial [uncultured Pseudonocardia sp.]